MCLYLYVEFSWIIYCIYFYFQGGTPSNLEGSDCPHVGNTFCLNGGTCVFFKDVGEPACKYVIIL